ncbi:MAG: response regulator [Pseudomonadota bacterium]|nr:response regulator [Pseudomonadota bacterium]
MRILLVEDDALLAKATRIGLEQAQFVVDHVTCRQQVTAFLASYEYAVMLLDLGLPDGDGIGLLQQLRQQRNPLPIIILTARDQVKDRIHGLQAGADDFVIKPYDLHEVIARIGAVTRRALGRTDQQVQHGELCVNIDAQTVLYQQQPISLTSREFHVLRFLLDHRGQILTRQQIEDALYPYAEDISSNSVEVHIHHLRKKLDKTLIRTVHAVGYTIDRLP